MLITFGSVLVAQRTRVQTTYHCEIARPQGAAGAAALNARSDHAVAAALAAVEREVIVLPTHAALTAALTQLHLDVFKVERVRGRKVQRT